MTKLTVNEKYKIRVILFLFLIFLQIKLQANEDIYASTKESKQNVEESLSTFSVGIHQNTLSILQELKKYQNVTDFIQTDEFQQTLKLNPDLENQINEILDIFEKIKSFLSEIAKLHKNIENNLQNDSLRTKRLSDLTTKIIKLETITPYFTIVQNIQNTGQELVTVLENLGESLKNERSANEEISATLLSFFAKETEILNQKLLAIDGQINEMNLLPSNIQTINQLIQQLVNKTATSSQDQQAILPLLEGMKIISIDQTKELVKEIEKTTQELTTKNKTTLGLIEEIFQRFLVLFQNLDFDYLSETLADSFNQTTAISSKLRNIEMLVEQLLSNLDQANNQNKNLKQTIASQQKNLDEKDRKINLLEERNTNTTKANSSFQSDLERERQKNDHLTNQLEKANQDLASITGQAKKQETTNQQLLENLTKEKSSTADLANQKKQLEGFLQMYGQREAMYQAAMSRMQQEFQQNIFMMQQQMAYLSQALNNSRQQGYNVDPQVMQMQQQMAAQFQQQQQQLEKMKSEQDKMKEDQIKNAQKMLEDKQNQMALDQIKENALRDKMDQMKTNQQQKDDLDRRTTDARITDSRITDQTNNSKNQSSPAVVINQGFNGLAMRNNNQSFQQKNAQTQVDLDSDSFWQQIRQRLQNLEQDHNSQISRLASYDPRLQRIETALNNLSSG